MISTNGGSSRLLISGGRRPRFSPDGKRIASTATGLFVIDSSGGQPRDVTPQFRSARDGIWSPDGNHLLFAGCKDSSAETCDWWISPGRRRRAGRHGRSAEGARPVPRSWLSDNAIVFANGGLWSLNLATNPWRVLGTPQRLTPAGTTRAVPRPVRAE